MLEPQTFRPYIDSFYDPHNQVYDWVIKRARQLVATHEMMKSTLDGPTAFVRYQQECRQRFLDSIGGVPNVDGPLNVQETGKLQRAGYAITKLIYQSMPSVYVTANLYMPDHLEETPAPAALVLCGHSKVAKAFSRYQQVAIALTKAGFVTLTIDPPGQGEMVQCVDRHTGEPLHGTSTHEHSHVQLPAYLLQQNIARYFIINAQRAMDLLCGLPQVDRTRIGVNGISGGGCQTLYLMMTDPRVATAMPGCTISSRLAYLETGVRMYDGEQNLYGCIPMGVDYEDMLACFAPKPVLLAAAEYDFYCIEGTLETYANAKRLYGLFGADNQIELCVAKGQRHGYTTPLRQACVNWFRRHLQNKPDDDVTGEPDIENADDLQCTKSGQVMVDFSDARSVMDLHRETQHQRIKEHPPCSMNVDEVARRLGIPLKRDIVRPRITDTQVQGDTIIEHVFFFSEPGICVAAIIYRPTSPPTQATIMLLPNGTEGQQPHCALITSLLEQGGLVMVLDVRGTGAVRMRPRSRVTESHAFRSAEFRVASDLFMLRSSMLALRTFDVLRGVDYLRTREDMAGVEHIGLFGEATYGLYGLHAAALEPALRPCVFTDMLCSYADVLERGTYSRSVIAEHVISPEIHAQVDVVDLMALICSDGRPAVRLVRPRSADGDVEQAQTILRQFCRDRDWTADKAPFRVLNDDPGQVVHCLSTHPKHNHPTT